MALLITFAVLFCIFSILVIAFYTTKNTTRKDVYEVALTILVFPMIFSFIILGLSF